MCTCLRDSEKILGDINHATEILDVVDAALDSVDVVLPRTVQDGLDLVGVVVGEVLVHRPNVRVHAPVDGEQRQHDNGLLVHDVDLIADGCDGKTGASGKQTNLAGQAVAGQSVEDRIGGGLRVLDRNLRRLAIGATGGGGVEGSGEGGRGGADREGWASAGGA